jgi:hypothetical protein
MSKAEKFISDCTRNCSNEIIVPTQDGNTYTKGYNHWLAPDQARRAVEIAREETLQEVKSKLLDMLNTSIDNKHFFEQLDDYIDELETSNER